VREVLKKLGLDDVPVPDFKGPLSGVLSVVLDNLNT